MPHLFGLMLTILYLTQLVTELTTPYLVIDLEIDQKIDLEIDQKIDLEIDQEIDFSIKEQLESRYSRSKFIFLIFVALGVP